MIRELEQGFTYFCGLARLAAGSINFQRRLNFGILMINCGLFLEKISVIPVQITVFIQTDTCSMQKKTRIPYITPLMLPAKTIANILKQ